MLPGPFWTDTKPETTVTFKIFIITHLISLRIPLFIIQNQYPTNTQNTFSLWTSTNQ